MLAALPLTPGAGVEQPSTLLRHRRTAARLRRFWGRVAQRQDAMLGRLVAGRRVLEIGCGYGALVASLSQRGFTAVGVDRDAPGLVAGREVLGPLPAVVGDAYALPFRDGAFDSVLFRDSWHHLISERALAEAARLTTARVIIFEPNVTPFLRLARLLVHHADREMPVERTVASLRRGGWTIERVVYRDLLALPLSGGYIGPELVPPIPLLGTLLIAADRALTKLVRILGLARWCCWRYAVVARRRDTRGEMSGESA